MSNADLSVTCECTPVYEAQYGEAGGVTPTEAVIGAVAEVEGVDPTELDPLYETIDGDALDQLLAASSESASPSRVVRFSVAGWNVFVRDDGQIRVCDPSRPADPAPAFNKPVDD